jgi:PTS system nitrogen regulatory IIA component
MTNISEYLDEQLICFLDTETRDESIRKMVDILDETGKLSDENAFYEAIVEREKIVSTGIGMGVAIPHAKLPEYSSFFIAIGILSQRVEWHALDEAPVRLIFMIGGPDDKQTEYLQILSSLTLAIRDEEKRKKLLQESDAKAIIGLFNA